MTLYTSKVVAQWLCLTERRVRQLRDEGVIVEARPGLYELQPTVARYITYIGGAGKETLTNERMMLTRAKREAAEMENDLRRGEVHRTADIERGIHHGRRSDGYLRRAERGHRGNSGGNERLPDSLCGGGR